MALNHSSNLEHHEQHHENFISDSAHSSDNESNLTTDESLAALAKAKINLGNLSLPGISSTELKANLWNLVATGKLKLNHPFNELNLYSITNSKNFYEGSGFNFDGPNKIMTGDGMVKFTDLGEFGERIMREIKLNTLFDEKRKKHFNINAFEGLDGNTYANWENSLRTLMEQGSFDFDPYSLDKITRFGIEPVLNGQGEMVAINFVSCNTHMPDAFTITQNFNESKIPIDHGLGADLKRQWNQKEGWPNYDVRKAMKQDSMHALNQIIPAISM